MSRLQAKPQIYQVGFTLIELLVVIAIVGVLATFAAPSMIQFARKSAMQTLSNDFTGAVQKARVEAVTRNTCTTICKSNSTNSAAPRCTPGAAGVYDANDWHMGWIVFINTGCDRGITAANPANAGDILIVRQPGDVRYKLNSPSSTKSLTFGPQGGMDLATAGKFSLTDNMDNNAAMNRVICVDKMGRTRILADGAICSL